MPIDVFRPIGPAFGPGLAFFARSTELVIDEGPTHWQIRVIGGPQEREIMFWSLDSSSNDCSGVIGVPRVHPIPAPDYAPPAGTGITLEIGVQSADGLRTDTGTVSGFQWEPTLAQWSQAMSLAGGETAGGFTEQDRLQLQNVDLTSQQTRQAVITTVTTTQGTIDVDLGSAFRWISPDFWQDRPLSGGVTCERIDYDASLNALYGVSLRIDSLPEDIPFRTPDSSWSLPDLAVLTFLRHGTILQRHGIHTLTHSVSPLPGSLWFGAFGVNAPIQPTGYHITVDWLAGVCGELIGNVLPI